MAQVYAAKYLAKAALSAPRDLVRAAVANYTPLHPTVFIFHCTFVCDARCEMCSNWTRGNRKEDMTLEQIDRAFSSPLWKDIENASLSGGEPTTRNDMVDICRVMIDRFPKLRMILGHMGEALPYWAYRLDYMHAATVRSKRYASVQPLDRRPSDYLRENFYITNSGVAWPAAIKFAQEFMGVDRVLYAMDYPYQYAPDEVNMLDDMDLSLEDKTKFFQANAQHVFKLR